MNTLLAMKHAGRVLFVSAAVACIALAVSDCAKKGAATDATQPLAVTAVAARRGEISERLALTGVVAAKQQANLSSAITGEVLGVDVNVGDAVGAGQVLVRIDDSTLRAQLAQNLGSLVAAQARLAQTQSGDTGAVARTDAQLDSARVAYDTAEANARRNHQLLTQGYVSQAAVDDADQAAAAASAQLRTAEIAAQDAKLSGTHTSSAAQSEIRSLQAAVDEAAGAVALARAQIAQAVVTAPFAGIVTQRSVDPGSFAVPGTALIQVSQLDPVYVNIGIPEENLPYIHTGTAVDITLDSLPGQVWHGTVSTVNAATTQGTLSYLARVILPNDRLTLKSGMVANTSFIKQEHKDVVLVPRAAVFQGENGDAVYVLNKAAGCKCDGKAKIVYVRRGLETDTEAEVNGIQAGTRVLVQRPDNLKDGSPVSITPLSSQSTSTSGTPQ